MPIPSPTVHCTHSSNRVVLMHCFPEVALQPKKKHAPVFGYWTSLDNQRSFMEKLKEKLCIFRRKRVVDEKDIKDPSDWHSISVKQFQQAGGAGMLKRHRGSLLRTLRALYPDMMWQPYKVSTPHHVPKGSLKFSKTQYLLFQHVKSVSDNDMCLTVQIVPDADVILNQSYNFGTKKRPMEFDVSSNTIVTLTLPDIYTCSIISNRVQWRISLQSRADVSLFGMIAYCISFDSDSVKKRDLQKRSMCELNGITLIIIPYWWDRSIQSIATAIYSVRPDVQRLIK